MPPAAPMAAPLTTSPTLIYLVMVLSTVPSAFGQQESSEKDEKEQTVGQQRQREEMADNEDVELEKPEVEEEVPVIGLREDMNILFAEFLLDESRKFDGSRYNNVFLVGFRWTIEI
jgi:hypothetical protein